MIQRSMWSRIMDLCSTLDYERSSSYYPCLALPHSGVPSTPCNNAAGATVRLHTDVQGLTAGAYSPHEWDQAIPPRATH